MPIRSGASIDEERIFTLRLHLHVLIRQDVQSPLGRKKSLGDNQRFQMIGLEIILLAVFGFMLLYLALLSILAVAARKRFTIKFSRYRRMAFVVPAHDEELAIEKTLRSLFGVDYPRQYFDVIVVADNCTDRTAEIARTAGAIVYERRDASLRGKGYALRWCFDHLLSGRLLYEAVVVVDADSVVSSNFLGVMNFYLENGAKAIQCSDMVDVERGSWSAEITHVGFTLYNYVRPLGRRMIGCSAGLRGNGMCLAVETLRSVRWQACSLTEDLEYGLTLLLNGISVVFAPEASVRAMMPRNAENAQTQRTRWEMGRFPLIRKYAARLLGAAIKQRSLGAFDAFVDLTIPPLVNLVAFATLLFLLSLLLWGLGFEETARFAWFWLALIAMAAVHVFVGLYAAHADVRTYRAILYVPRYAFWKLVLYARTLQYGEKKGWVRTPREALTVQQNTGERLKD
jgi:1,2-diacylglycerol 3-beta-glucosyltransferase